MAPLHKFAKKMFDMKHNSTPLLLVLAICFSVSLFGQKNEDLKKANKQYDLHAYNLALKSYKKVLDKSPNNVEALSSVADSYRHLGKMEEAATYYKKAIQQPGVDPINLLHYGQTLMSLGDYENAEEWLLTYAEGQPLFGNHYAESCRFAMSLRGVSALYRVKKEYINTSSSDFSPAFFGDDVVYSSSNKELLRKMEQENANWEGEAMNQLFISGVDKNGFLTKSKFLLNDLQNTYNEGSVSYSENGKWVAFAKNNFVDGTRQIPSSGIELSIYIAEANEKGGWKDARPFPYNGSGYSSGFPHLSADGQTLYFATNRPDGFGGFDIYVSYRTGSTWSTPENLGPVINSEGNEITPFMEAGNLYFASDWHHGLGGMDIFRASSENGLWNKVFHLGNAVNSPSDDYGFIYKSKSNKGYFVSNRKGGSGKEDIYQVSKLSESIVLKVLDADTREGVMGANLDFTGCGEAVYQTDAYGTYSFQAFQGLSCDVIVSLKGYRSRSVNVSSGDRTMEKEITVSLAKMEGDVVTTNPGNGNLPGGQTGGNGGGTTTNANKGYSGFVVNAVDNAAVGTTYITAVSRKTGADIKTISDENGMYYLDLLPNETYIIRYSKAGFTDTHQQVLTGNGANKSILGILNFIPSGTNLESTVEVVNNNGGGNGNGNGQETGGNTSTTSTSTTTTAGSSNSNSNSSSNSNSTGDVEVVKTNPKPQVVQEGFSIQIAAIGIDENIKVGKYASLTEVGNLYGRQQKGMKKIRVGIYPSRSEAVEAQKEITAKGFKKSFIVAERVEDYSEIEMYGTQEEEEVIPVPEPEPTIALNENGKYMIRLATYKNAKFFDASKVSAFGNVVERFKGNMTIKLLAGYMNRADAEKAKLKAIESGFKGAHIVIEEDGDLKKI